MRNPFRHSLIVCFIWKRTLWAHFHYLFSTAWALVHNPIGTDKGVKDSASYHTHMLIHPPPQPFCGLNNWHVIKGALKLHAFFSVFSAGFTWEKQP